MKPSLLPEMDLPKRFGRPWAYRFGPRVALCSAFCSCAA